MTKKKILIATGGTGGHIFPALSLANNLIQKDYSVQLTTDKRGFKYIKDYKDLSFIKLSSSPLIKKNILEFLQSSSIILNSIRLRLNLNSFTFVKILSKYLETIQSLKNLVGTPRIK